MDKVKPTSVRLPESLKKAIKKKAEEDGRSFNNMVNKMLKEAVS